MCGNGGGALRMRNIFATELTGSPDGSATAMPRHSTPIRRTYQRRPTTMTHTVFARASKGSRRHAFCDKYPGNSMSTCGPRMQGSCVTVVAMTRNPASWQNSQISDQRPAHAAIKANGNLTSFLFARSPNMSNTRFRASPIGKPILTRPFERWSWNVRQLVFFLLIETGSSIDKWSATTYGTRGSLLPGRRGVQLRHGPYIVAEAAHEKRTKTRCAWLSR